MKLFFGLLLSLLTVSGMNAASTWTTVPFTAQTGSFVVEFDATPDSAFIDGALTLTNVEGSAATYSLMACVLSFRTTGVIQARNGGAYAAVNSLTYAGGTKYHVKMDINVTTHKYDVVVTPNGGAEVIIATGYSFRTEQATITQLQFFSKVITTLNAPYTGRLNGLVLENLVIGGASIPTAISSISSSSFDLYPNPLASGSQLTVNLGSKVNGIVEIFDVDGKLAYKNAIVGESKTNIAASLKSGIYIVRVTNGTDVYNKKLVVK